MTFILIIILIESSSDLNEHILESLQFVMMLLSSFKKFDISRTFFIMATNLNDSKNKVFHLKKFKCN